MELDNGGMIVAVYLPALMASFISLHIFLYSLSNLSSMICLVSSRAFAALIILCGVHFFNKNEYQAMLMASPEKKLDLLVEALNEKGVEWEMIRYNSLLVEKSGNSYYIVKRGLKVLMPDSSDEDQEAPDRVTYALSEIVGRTDDERKLIEDYNTLVEELYEEALAKSLEEYQTLTAYLRINEDADMVPTSSGLEKIFKQKGLDVDVEDMGCDTDYNIIMP
jgi:hypothetical protein